MKEGFITKDGYAAVPYGQKKLVIIYNGQQLDEVNTKLQAEKYIKKHRDSLKSGPLSDFLT